MVGIAIIRVPNSSEEDASEAAIRNLLSLSKGLFDDRIVFEKKFSDIGGVTTSEIEKRRSSSTFTSILYHFIFQIKLSLAILQRRDDIDVTLWHAGGFSLIVPFLVSRLLGNQVFLCVLGRAVDGYLNDDYWDKRGVGLGKAPLKYGMAILVGTVESFSFLLSTRIIVFSKNITDYLTLNWFENKIRTIRFNYQELPSVKPIDTRPYPMIYLGRICELKGADRLAAAVPLIEEITEFDEPVLFVGDGNMREELESNLKNHNVKFTGWLPRADALELVSKSKLFVLPSRSEGLPKALLEAMARGTVPVVSPVGDIPDVVSDSINGVFLDDLSPESLAETLHETLETEHVEMSRNATKTIKREFSYEEAYKDFKELFDNLPIRFQK